ncbi:MAG: hypothetical protein AAF822_00445 [Pseudomonadota bacterium]
MTWQDEVFVERLVRLDQNHARRMDRGADSAPRNAMDVGRGLSIAGAGLIGFLSVPLLRLAMYHSQGLPSAAARPEFVMTIDALFAFCIAFFLVRVILSVTSRAHMTAQVVGIWIALTTLHNAVHAYPDQWGQAFSPEWVAHVVQATEPNTLYLLGRSFQRS